LKGRAGDQPGQQILCAEGAHEAQSVVFYAYPAGASVKAINNVIIE
jgi:hypothetical protein